MTFRDRDVLVVGPVVPDVRASFDEFWTYRHSVPSSKLVDVAATIRKGEFRRYIGREDFAFTDICAKEDRDASDSDLIQRHFVDRLVAADHVEFVYDKPGKNRAVWLTGGGRITRRLVEVVEDARSEVVMQSPYFVLRTPTRAFLRELREAYPDLRMVVSSNSFGSTDNPMAYSANYRLRSAYIEDLDLEVYEFKPHPGELYTLHPNFDVYAERAEQRIAAGEQERGPFLCIHAKSAVFDRNLAYIGSYNLDPRSANLNTEVGFLIRDQRVAGQLRDAILTDCRPENSWVIAKRQMPLSAEVMNGLVENVMLFSPIDIWPIRNTSSFELRPGMPAVPPNHPDFYTNYQDVGSFPGAPANLTMKEITTRLLKAVGPLAVSIL
jgi:phosphatidylserine/phosphatidylglycerophosphate/cardiolipin synthase-like enzyme